MPHSHAAGGSALALKLDVTKEEDFGRAFQAAKLRFGRLDAVFANAGWGGALSRGLLLNQYELIFKGQK